MEIVIDSNVLFSALIRESTTRRLILNYSGYFLFPEYIFIEAEKHIDFLLKKSGMLKGDFFDLLQMILQKVLVVPKATTAMHEAKALNIIKNIDKDDVDFIACALAYPGSMIWSDDKNLKKQNQVRVLNTAEILNLIY